MPEALASQGQKQQLSDKKLLLKLAKKYVADKKTLYILAKNGLTSIWLTRKLRNTQSY
ncbi:MAG: hypothetical protein JGK12_00645 [Microcoleus sp. PH2017_01_SCD_O_A]|uniref:hypothetical protein n=1 Tax=unclassified Microcoleus TaxID=2642155 RepID=UPI001E0E440C|nr:MULTISPECIES: hypothetical protein [unclassified Microcoleus]MCC3416722.1 hypothetical protein [Microcoleus sp. PH2017_07_MST_O_A]MCC3422453.1 hypothetical protein [Microcoleus sp. PH2017_01_SCD_O_A]MCC3610789.1 hypothetical protein [Microcoleus sp. PH2017_40_RAT_O_B]